MTSSITASIQLTYPGEFLFDDYPGSTDDQKCAAMNAFNASMGDGQTGSSIQPKTVFGPRDYNLSSTPIMMYSGMHLAASKGSNAHGVRIQPRINWSGPAGSSLLKFASTQASQGYPSDGSPRDMKFSGILFNGTSGTHFIENHNPVTDSSVGHVIWYSNFTDCAWTNFQTIHWGWVDGCAYDGSLDISQIGSTAFYLAGAESILFGRSTYSQADNSNDIGVPFIRSRLEKSLIGWCLFTGRGNTSGLSIEGGDNMVIDGFNVDAQDSSPMFGAGMHVSAVDGLTITNCSIKGVATAPASGQNGAAANKGYVHISGGSQITFLGNNFRREGTNLPATSYPLVYASGVGAGQVKFGYNGWSGYAGAGAVLQQAASGIFTTSPDPGLTIVTAA